MLIAGTVIQQPPSVDPPGMLVCSSFMIIVCVFIVSKALFISNATVIVRAGGAIGLNLFATVLFTVCSTVTVECCVLFCTRVAWVYLVCLLLCKEGGSSPVSFAITERRHMDLYAVSLSMSLLGFGMETMLANFYMCGIMLVVIAVFNMFVRNARAYVFYVPDI